MEDPSGGRVRLAELLGALSLVTDQATGYPADTAIQACILASELARLLELDENERHRIYYVTLLRYVGCMGTTHESASFFGDDVEFLHRIANSDTSRPSDGGRILLSMAGRVMKPVDRAKALTTIAARGKSIGEEVGRSHCEVAAGLAQQCRLQPSITAALYQIAKRWDGKGPNGVRGPEIALSTRMAPLPTRPSMLTCGRSTD